MSLEFGKVVTNLATISQVTRTQPRFLAMLRMSQDNATMALVDLDELLEEGLNSRWRWGLTN